MYSDVFDNTFYNGVLSLREFDVVLSFVDDYHIAKSIMDFLDSLGFRITDKGYKFLVHIITESIKSDELSPSLNRWYEICAEKFSVSLKSVESGITNAIKTAGKSGKLEKLNEIFACGHVVFGNISNAMFINIVSKRFGIAHKYKQELCFKA